MAEDNFKVLVDVDNKFQNALNEASKKITDFTIPFQLITKSWFRSNRALFQLKGPGKFSDLSNIYKKTKQKKLGSAYPILRAYTRKIESSLIDPSSSDSINLIVNKNTLFLGTKVSYAPFLQLGTKYMPSRPFILIGAEQTGPEEFNTRRDSWIKIIQDYASQVLDTIGNKNG